MNTTTETPIRPGIHFEWIDPEIERIIRERRADKVGVTSRSGNLCSAPGDRQGVDGASPLSAEGRGNADSEALCNQ